MPVPDEGAVPHFSAWVFGWGAAEGSVRGTKDRHSQRKMEDRRNAVDQNLRIKSQQERSVNHEQKTEKAAKLAAGSLHDPEPAADVGFCGAAK